MHVPVVYSGDPEQDPAVQDMLDASGAQSALDLFGERRHLDGKVLIELTPNYDGTFIHRTVERRRRSNPYHIAALHVPYARQRSEVADVVNGLIQELDASNIYFPRTLFDERPQQTCVHSGAIICYVSHTKLKAALQSGDAPWTHVTHAALYENRSRDKNMLLAVLLGKSVHEWGARPESYTGQAASVPLTGNCTPAELAAEELYVKSVVNPAMAFMQADASAISQWAYGGKSGYEALPGILQHAREHAQSVFSPAGQSR